MSRGSILKVLSISTSRSGSSAPRDWYQIFDSLPKLLVLATSPAISDKMIVQFQGKYASKRLLSSEKFRESNAKQITAEQNLVVFFRKLRLITPCGSTMFLPVDKPLWGGISYKFGDII